MPITMVASTNYPERLPNRLIRPKRLENIIKFDIPLPLNVIDSTLRVHIESNLKEIFETS
jgi:SpoVK/Ycf46/Vps4 family AAA+-type ATPase